MQSAGAKVFNHFAKCGHFVLCAHSDAVTQENMLDLIERKGEISECFGALHLNVPEILRLLQIYWCKYIYSVNRLLGQIVLLYRQLRGAPQENKKGDQGCGCRF